MGQKKAVTTINLSRKVLLDIRGSGVRNVSKYFEDLAKADLYNIDKLSKNEQEVLLKHQKELEYWRSEWEQYLKKMKVTA